MTNDIIGAYRVQATYEYNEIYREGKNGKGETFIKKEPPKIKGVNFFINNSKFAYHNKILDSVVKTIRDAIGYRELNHDQLQQIINYYNDTYHSYIIRAVSPKYSAEVEENQKIMVQKDV